MNVTDRADGQSANDRDGAVRDRSVPTHNGSVVLPVKLRWLEYFDAVAEELHFGRAADVVQVATPTLSQQIRQLEATLGVELFERTSRRVRLTPSGAALHARIRPALRLIAEAIEDTGARGASDAPALAVGFVSALAGGVMPDAVHRFHAARPRTRVRLEQLGAREQLQRLAAGTLDAGLHWQVGAARTDAVPPRELIARTTLHVALPESHRLAAEGDLELSQLADEEWLASADGSDDELRNGFVALCRDHGFTPAMRSEAMWIGLLHTLVGAGLGVCASPGPEIHPAAAGVRLRPLRGCEIRLVAVRRVPYDPRTDRLIADVRAAMHLALGAPAP